MLKNSNLLITLFLLATITNLPAQQVLEKTEAVKIALENNFDIRIADNTVLTAKNNATVRNSRYLPSITTNGTANFSNTYAETTLHDGSVNIAESVKTSRYNASLGLNYTVFDGFGREYAFKSLKENYNLSELQARSVIENTLVNLFFAYYEIARLSENELNQKQTLDISRDRLLRVKYSSEYGQKTKLDVLNAEVDYNTDSINYLTIVQLLENEKRNLNLLLGRDVDLMYVVDTAIVYAPDLSYKEIKEKAAINNISILLAESSLRNAAYNIKTVNSARIPKLGLSASYGTTYNELGVTSFADKQFFIGPSAGLTLSWNIFDGGTTNIRRQNSKIALDNQEITLAQTKLTLNRNVSNAWNIYKTALFILEAERTNMRTNQRNFDRSAEQHSLGQITSIEFRQAQLNLLTAKLNYNKAKYSAKIAELALFQLRGDLLDAQF